MLVGRRQGRTLLEDQEIRSLNLIHFYSGIEPLEFIFVRLDESWFRSPYPVVSLFIITSGHQGSPNADNSH